MPVECPLYNLAQEVNSGVSITSNSEFDPTRRMISYLVVSKLVTLREEMKILTRNSDRLYHHYHRSIYKGRTKDTKTNGKTFRESGTVVRVRIEKETPPLDKKIDFRTEKNTVDSFYRQEEQPNQPLGRASSACENCPNVGCQINTKSDLSYSEGATKDTPILQVAHINTIIPLENLATLPE